MSITERLANLDYKTVIITCLVLLGIRYILLKQKSAEAKWFAEIAESLAVAMALVFLLIRPFVVQAFFIPSASMHPTLLEQDHILVNKFIYRVSQPKRGDVIVFKAPLKATPEFRPGGSGGGWPQLAGSTSGRFRARRSFEIGKDFIKRVIAVPGDTVRITPGYVVIGGMPYHHSRPAGCACGIYQADATTWSRSWITQSMMMAMSSPMPSWPDCARIPKARWKSCREGVCQRQSSG